MCSSEGKSVAKLETALEETWLRELKQKAANMLWREMHEEKDAIIFRVPDNIRSADPEAYNPKLVSLGPYHHRRLREWDEKLKWPYLNKFLARNKQVSMEEYLKLIKESEKRARSAYSEHVDMDSNDFAEMMLLDCCFVLEFLLLQYEEQKRRNITGAQQKEGSHAVHPNNFPRTTTRASTTIKRMSPMETTTTTTITTKATMEAATEGGGSGDQADPVKRKRRWALPLIQHDLLMLENQLPLFLLQCLFEKAPINDVPSLTEIIVNFFGHFSLFPENKKKKTQEDTVNDHSMNCCHLLDLFHSCILPTESPNENKTRHRGASDGHKKLPTDPAFSIPCARELREARVKFVKKNAKEGTTFMNISFHRPKLFDVARFRSSRLEIPEIRIDDDTNALFRNLIAFEQCCPGTDDHVSVYASFMDALIDTGADVALLRQRRIVVSGLGSDNDVAQLFNQLCKEVTIDPENCYLKQVMIDVNEHSESRWNRCCASLKHTYFSNRWLFLSVIAAIILFVLTFLQTLYSILGYKKQ